MLQFANGCLEDGDCNDCDGCCVESEFEGETSDLLPPLDGDWDEKSLPRQM